MLLNGMLQSVGIRTIILDLTLRNSKPDKFSPCPYLGQEHVLMKQLGKQAQLEVISKLEKCSDFTAEQMRVIDGPYVNVPSRVWNGERRLEHIDSSWVYAYYTWMVIGLKINDKNSIKSIEKEEEVHRTWTDEDSEEVSESSLLMVNNKYHVNEALEIRDRMIYILKRLHERSKHHRISLISLIIAYNKADSKSSGIVLKKGVYKMNKSGYLSDAIKRNEGNYSSLFNWVSGAEPDDTFYKDYQELEYLCNKVGIDLRKETPHDYDEDFISQLTVTYITENRTYYMNEYRSMDKRVYDSLSSIKLEDYGIKNHKSKQQISLAGIIEQIKFRLTGSNASWRDVENLKQTVDFLYTFSLIYDDSILSDLDNNEYITEDGFLKKRGGAYYILDVSNITRKPFIPNAKAIIHSSGTLVLVTLDNSLYTLDCETAMRYITDYEDESIKGIYGYEGNKNFGTWSEL